MRTRPDRRPGVPRDSGAVYGHSQGAAPGSKHWYRPVFSGSSWDQFLGLHAIAPVLQVCCGGSSFGLARVDCDHSVPGVNVCGDMTALPFRSGSFPTVCCDPMYALTYPDRIHLQRELTRVASRRVIFKAPWIPRATDWDLVEMMLIGSHTCANVAVMTVLESHGQPDLIVV